MQIFNSFTQKKTSFKPIEPGKVSLYVCGITVYDYCHIGHARTTMAFDVIYRYLKHKGYEVNYVRNITDIDDKIINRAIENKETTTDLTERFICAMHEDFNALGMLPPSHEPRATQFVTDMIAMIENLIDKNAAYVCHNGDVYYHVPSFKKYGELSHQNLDALQAGARVNVDTHKRSPLDFVLWKNAKPDEPAWDSPWGKGRPGWHIECSVMSCHHLGKTIDIHGGGFDLKFPHHENEVAQSEVANDAPFVNSWMHVGFINIDDEKMSKSLNNFFTIRDVLKLYSPETIRLFLISSHYRSPIHYSENNLNKAKQSVNRLYTALRGLPEGSETKIGEPYKERFFAAMDDDFNTADAISVLFELTKEVNLLRDDDPENAANLAVTLKRLANILGLLTTPVEQFFHEPGLDAATIEALMNERNQARVDKNWAKADKIRQQLTDLGVTLEDNAAGTTWRKS